MIGKNKKGPEDKIEATILESVPAEGIFFETLENKVLIKMEKLKIKRVIIKEKITALIKWGQIKWEGTRLKIPPTTHPPSFFC